MRGPWWCTALLVGAAAAFFPACGDARTQGVTSDAHATACGSCHTAQAAAWSGSRHANSIGSPVFQALLPKVADAWGDDARVRCISCHSPKHGGDDGIGCVSCHAASGNAGEGDGKLLVDLTAPVSGPFDDATPTPAHGSRRYDLLESPVLCGTCHQVSGPGLLVEPTLSEFRASPAAAGGRTCASCHMPSIDPAPIATGEDGLRARVSHGFVGIDPPWGAKLDVRARAAKDSAELLSSALRMAATASADHGVDVTLTNDAGHAVPTGVAFLRRIWVDAVFTDAAGKVLATGAVLTLGAVPTKDGAPVALITDADNVTPNALAPATSSGVHVPPPAGMPAPVSVEVRLHARAVAPETLAALGLSERANEVPTHDLGAVHVTLR
jgi:hypothetical protein